MKFLELYYCGGVAFNEVDYYVDMWHNTETEESLHAFLGMSWNEYQKWVVSPSHFIDIFGDSKLNKIRVNKR